MGPNLVEDRWGRSGVVRESLEKVVFELCVDRRLVLSTQSQYLDSCSLILPYWALWGAREKFPERHGISQPWRTSEHFM